jgi:hypothetical protein
VIGHQANAERLHRFQDGPQKACHKAGLPFFRP